MNKELMISKNSIKDKIHNIRGVRVMIDSDLAVLYEVPTKALNQTVKRNIERFPSDFMFQLTDGESKNLICIKKITPHFSAELFWHPKNPPVKSSRSVKLHTRENHGFSVS